MPPLSFNPFQQGAIWPSKPKDSSKSPQPRRLAGTAREQQGAIPTSPPPPPLHSAHAPDASQTNDRVYQQILTSQTTADFWIQQKGLNPF